MALTAVTQEEFIKIASEEGIPLSLASSIWYNESRGGTNQSALVDPRLKAGKKNASGTFSDNADKIGYGSMQVIRPTFESVMPGVDYFSADDADLTRAGMRVLKPAVKSDGSFDLQKAKNLYFGTGKDASFGGLSTSTDSRVNDNMTRIIAAVSSNDKPDASLHDIMFSAVNAKAPTSNVPSASMAEAQVQQKKSEAESLIEFDPVAAQAKFDEAKEMKAAQLTAILNKQLEGQTRALNLAEMNPYGAYGEAEATFEALKTANGRMRQTVSDAHFQTKPANEGVLGILETFARKIAADENLPQITKETNDLQKAANDYQVVLSNLMKNGAQGSIDFKDQIAIDSASRTAGNDALNIDFKAIGVEQKNAAANARNQISAQAEAGRMDRFQSAQQLKEAQAQTKNERDARLDDAKSYKFAEDIMRADRDFGLKKDKFALSSQDSEARRGYLQENTRFKAVQIRNLEQKIELDATRATSQAQLDALNGNRLRLDNLKKEQALLGNFGTDNMDEISKAANAVMGTTKIWKMSEINAIFKTKEDRAKLVSVLAAGGDKSVLRNPNVGANIAELQATGSPIEREAADKLAKDYGAAIGAAAKRNPIKLGIDSDKTAAAKDAAYTVQARTMLAGRPTSDINFSSNSLNVKPMADWIEIAGMEGGLADTLKAAKIDASSLPGDAALVSTLLIAQSTGKLPVDYPVLLDQLNSYYTTLASTRANQEILYKANIPIRDDLYVVQTTDKKNFDLAERASLARYIEKVKNGLNTQMRRAQSPVGSRVIDFFTGE